MHYQKKHSKYISRVSQPHSSSLIRGNGNKVLGNVIYPSAAVVTFVECTKKQKIMKII